MPPRLSFIKQLVPGTNGKTKIEVSFYNLYQNGLLTQLSLGGVTMKVLASDALPSQAKAEEERTAVSRQHILSLKRSVGVYVLP